MKKPMMKNAVLAGLLLILSQPVSAQYGPTTDGAPVDAAIAADPAQTAALAQPSACLDKNLESAAILADGRTVPLAIHAKRFRKAALADTCKSLSDTALYCLLSTVRLADLQAEHACQVNLKVEHEKLKSIIGVAAGTASAPHEAIRAKSFELENDYKDLEAKKQLETGYGVALEKLLNGNAQFESILRGDDWKTMVGAGVWKKKNEFASSSEFLSAVAVSSAFVGEKEMKAMSHEVLYEKLRLFGLSAGICVLAFVLSIAGQKSPRMARWATGVAISLILLEAFTMYLRTVVSGRAPVTNMFETVMWTGFGVLGLSIIMSGILRERMVLTLGLAVNMIALFMMNFATTMLDGSIRPLVPVLRDNFWLSTHVTTVTLAYSAFAMSWIAANYVLGSYLLGMASEKLVDRWNHISRIAMQVGSVLLAGGIILGGVWADYSWGRFWGWDPKETWSLIALMIYIGVLHGKYVGWFTKIRFAMAGAASFLFVLMAWFGVNYILAAGLHSYGFSTGGALFLGSVFAGQGLVLAVTFGKEFFSNVTLPSKVKDV